jgi:hypothetical protein
MRGGGFELKKQGWIFPDVDRDHFFLFRFFWSIKKMKESTKVKQTPQY